MTVKPIEISKINSEILNAEMSLFLEYKKLLAKHNNYFEIDDFGFVLTSEPKPKPEINVLICALTHGNEVIGLQIINLILLDILRHGNRYNIGFLLNNVKAYHKNVRFIDSDLNRSFLKTTTEPQAECKRAKQIEKIIDGLNIKLILDLHQTVEAALSPFAIIPEAPDLIQKAYKIAPKTPVVSFKTEGFSAQGKTLVEYAYSKKIPALVYELGEKGFKDTTAHEFKDLILNLSIENILDTKNTQKTDYFHMECVIPNKNNLRLVPGLVNFMDLNEGQILARNQNGDEFRTPYSGKLIFPRYQNIGENEAELGYIAVRRFI